MGEILKAKTQRHEENFYLLVCETQVQDKLNALEEEEKKKGVQAEDHIIRG